MATFEFKFKLNNQVIEEVSFSQAWEIMQACEMLGIRTFALRTLTTYLPFSEYVRFVNEVNNYIDSL